nr:helix-turn-helix domain-containing protein [Sphingorhabdus sp. EL138]
MAQSAELLGDKWTMLILREAFYGVRRYDDMRADLGAPRSMLTDRLAKLVAHGLMEKRPYQEPGSRARNAYVLTPMGNDLALTLLALSQWGEKYALEEETPIQIRDKETGKLLKVALVDESGNEIALSRATIVPTPRS